MSLDPRTLTNEDAGLYMLYWINNTYPGVTYEQIIEASRDRETMQGMFSSIGRIVGKGIKAVSKVVTSPAVLSYQAAKWTTKQGIKYAVNKLQPKQTLQAAQQGTLTPEDRAILDQIGSQTKRNYNNEILGMNPMFLMGGGALVLGGIVFLLTRRRK